MLRNFSLNYKEKFHLNKYGTIKDIHLKDLKNVLSDLYGYITNLYPIKKDENISIRILKSVYDSINEYNNGIIGIPYSIEDKDFYNTISKRLNKCFKVSKDKNNFKEILRYDIKNLENSLFISMKEKNDLDFENYSDMYIDILNAFSKELSKFIKYNLKTAYSDITNIGGKWDILDYIYFSITRLISESIALKDKNIIYKMISFVYKMIMSAMSEGNHLIYQKYFPLFNVIYYYTPIRRNPQN